MSYLESIGIVLCKENKGADQLRGYCEADLRLCFRIWQNFLIIPLLNEPRYEKTCFFICENKGADQSAPLFSLYR